MCICPKAVDICAEESRILHSDAVFIADSHYFSISSSKSSVFSHTLLETFIKLLQTPPLQIFLMGDIAHLLLGAIQSSIESNCILLDHIAKLAQVSEVWWFEGNHDFGLQHLVKKHPALSYVRFVPRAKQPLSFITSHKKRVLLAHGDLFLNLKYECYIQAMNSKVMSCLLFVLDKITSGKLYSAISTRVHANSIRVGEAEIQSFAQKRIETYARRNMRADIIIEGHFHIGGQAQYQNTLYVALPSFYIHRSIFRLESALI